MLLFIQTAFAFPLLGDGIINSHDGLNHVARIASFSDALAHFHIPPRWGADLNFTFGTPVFNFFYTLPYFVGSLLVFAGLPYEHSFNLLVFLVFIAAPLSMYLFLRSIHAAPYAFAGSLLYGLAPYHFLNSYVRGDIGELFAYALTPLFFLGLVSVRKIQTVSLIVCASIYAFIILSHNAVSLILSVVAFWYIVLFSPKKHVRFARFGALLLGLCLSAYYWIPALAEQRYTHIALFTASEYTHHFLRIPWLFYRPWGFADEIQTTGGMSPQVGPIHMLLFCVSLVLLGKKKDRRMRIFWTGVVVFSLVMATPLSEFFWDKLTILPRFQFPWRFLYFASLGIAVLSAYVFSLIRQSLLLSGTLLALLLISTIYIKHPQRISFHNEYYQTYPGSTYFHGEATPVWTAGDPSSYPNNPVEVISGSAEITQYHRTPAIHSWIVSAKQESRIKDNTLFFPGWRVFVDGVLIPVEFQDPFHRGLITFVVPEGKHRVEVKFTETKVRTLSNTTSLLSGITIFLIFCYTLLTRLAKRRQ